MTTDPTTAKSGQGRNFVVRLIAAVVLAPLTVVLAYLGGMIWAALATLVAIGLLTEWVGIVGTLSIRTLGPGLVGLLAAGICAALGRFDLAIAAAAFGAIAAAIAAPGQRGWIASGIVYAAVPLIAAVVLRRDQSDGLTAVVFVLLVVWATDSGGYFAGRAIGGPKLWSRVSPNKTWAGAVGGFIGALLVGAGFIWLGGGFILPLLGVAAGLSIAAQLGDLFESAVKRRFGVKDSGRMIPGHGGLLDRLDGVVAALMLAAVIGVLRGGSDGAGRGLMVW